MEPQEFNSNYDYLETFHGVDIYAKGEEFYFAECRVWGKYELVNDRSLELIKNFIARDMAEKYEICLKNIALYFNFDELDLTDSDSIIDKIMMSIKNKLDEFER